MNSALNENNAASGEPVVKIGSGIATGEIVAGYASTDSRATYTCIGKTVHFAARLEGRANRRFSPDREYQELA